MLEEAKKFERMRQELRGREYTYDSNGDIIVVQPIDPEKLPPNRVNIKVSIRDVTIGNICISFCLPSDEPGLFEEKSKPLISFEALKHGKKELVSLSKDKPSSVRFPARKKSLPDIKPTSQVTIVLSFN